MTLSIETIAWEGHLPGFVRAIDQTLLPEKMVVLEIRTVDEMCDAIRRLCVRGAPAIGVAAAFGVLLGVQRLANRDARNVAGVCSRRRSALAPFGIHAIALLLLFWCVAL